MKLPAIHVEGFPGGVLVAWADGTMSFGQIGECGWYWTLAAPRPPRSQLLTIGMITREALRLFRNSNAFLKMIRGGEDEFEKTKSKLHIRLPNDYVLTPTKTVIS